MLSVKYFIILFKYFIRFTRPFIICPKNLLDVWYKMIIGFTEFYLSLLVRYFVLFFRYLTRRITYGFKYSIIYIKHGLYFVRIGKRNIEEYCFCWACRLLSIIKKIRVFVNVFIIW